MKKLLLFFLAVTSYPLIAQTQYGDLKINEKFDEVYEDYYELEWAKWNAYDMHLNENFISPGQTYSKWQQHLLGSTLSGSLDALLVMYEATCDKKYLYEFMRKATLVQHARADKFPGTPLPDPYWFKDVVPWHGRVLTAMTHFVVMVEEKSIAHLNLPPVHPSNPNEFNGFTTVGEFAEWINTSNQQVLDFLMLHFWRGTGNECMCKPHECPDTRAEIQRSCQLGQCDSHTEKEIMEVNLQAPFGTSLLYAYLANRDRTDYGVKVVRMARAYLIDYGGIFDSVQGSNAYVWYHNGWQLERDNRWAEWKHKTDQGIEKMWYAGGLDLEFPVLYNKYYSDITGVITNNQYFEDYQMVRFKNTFSRLIYRWYDTPISATYNNGDTFNENVGGPPGNNLAPAQRAAKNWIPLCKFDNTPGSMGDGVYEILMEFYINKEINFPADNDHYGGVHIRGLAQMCAANIEREGIITTNCRAVTDPTATPEKVLVLPNPALTNMKFILTKPQVKIVAIELRKIGNPNIGRHVDVSPARREVEIDLTGLPSGQYAAIIMDEDGDVQAVHVIKE